jgi:hypothetical protein
MSFILLIAHCYAIWLHFHPIRMSHFHSDICSSIIYGTLTCSNSPSQSLQETQHKILTILTFCLAVHIVLTHVDMGTSDIYDKLSTMLST